jgi:hypothetical protein
MEKQLISWCDEQRESNKVITRGIIFRKSLELLPSFCGGKKSKKCFQKMKIWFYCGFKKRCKISKRRISSSGQKLPKDWENKVKSIIVNLQKYRHHNEGVSVAGVAGCRMRIWAIQTRFPSASRTIATVLGVGGRIMSTERLVLPVRKRIG